MYHFKLEQFQGPLDLLLGLIQEDKLDISQISLARVADQYLQYIESNPKISPDELADFLVVATKLLLIKSRLLVPELALTEDEDPSTLANQLKIYREYIKAMEIVSHLIARHRFWFVRDKSPVTLQPHFSPGTVKAEKLREVFSQILRGLEKMVVLPRSVMEKTMSLQEKISQIKGLIKSASQLTFKNIMEKAHSRTEGIISFLALLELIKQQEIYVQQRGNFSDIVIRRQAR